MDILGIAPGKTVADIGAGSGWFTVRCRETCAGYWNRVRHRYQSGGPHVTLNLEFAKRTCAASNRYWEGLITRCRQGQFLLKTYHEVAQPIVLLRNLRASLSPRAKVGVIDRNGNGENPRRWRGLPPTTGSRPTASPRPVAYRAGPALPPGPSAWARCCSAAPNPCGS